MMVHWRLLSLMAIGLLLATSEVLSVDPTGSSKVHLFNPMITKIEYDSCTAEGELCNFTLSTRAAQYKLLNFGPNSPGTLITDGPFKTPEPLNRQTGFYKNGSFMLYRDHKKFVEGLLNQSDYINLSPAKILRISDHWLIPEASIRFNDDKWTVSTRDGVMVLCRPGRVTCSYLLFEDLVESLMFSYPNPHKNQLPVAAVAANRTRFMDANDFLLMVADQSGRLTQHLVHLVPSSNNAIPDNITHEPKGEASLSAIENIFHDSASIVEPRYLSNSRIEDKITNNTDKRTRGAYLQAITSIYEEYPDYSKSIKRTNEIKNATDIPLCLVHGYQQRLRDRRSGGLNCECLHKGKDHNPFVFNFMSPLSAGIASIRAMHIVNYENKSHIHIAYRAFINAKVKQIQNRYYHCHGRPLKEDQLNKDFNLTLNDVNANGGDCLPHPITNLPSDIIGFDDGRQCARTIALYDAIYTVHWLNESILTSFNSENMTKHYLDGVTFFINAAMNIKDTIYMFTHTNDLVIFKAKMTNDCTVLELDLSSFQQTLSESFVLPRAILEPNEPALGEPYLLDYRHLIHGAIDTEPSLTGATPKGPDPSSGSSSSSIVIIAVGVIFGGLIVATIVYCFCLQDSNGIQPDRVLARKPTKSVRKVRSPAEKMSELEMKTVRSAVKSNISQAGKPPQAQPQQKPTPQPVQQQPQPSTQSKVASPSVKSKSKKSRVISLKSPGMKSAKSSPINKTIIKSKGEKSPKSKSKSSANNNLKAASPSTGKSSPATSPTKGAAKTLKSSSASPKSTGSKASPKEVGSKLAAKKSKSPK